MGLDLGGKCFGYLDGDDLWTYDGKHVGKLQGDDIYGSDGKYLGELMHDHRLITNRSKKSWRGYSFVPYANRVGYVKYVDYVGYVMYAGYEDFPPPEAF
jgi:hypothetical protein